MSCSLRVSLTIDASGRAKVARLRAHFAVDSYGDCGIAGNGARLQPLDVSCPSRNRAIGVSSRAEATTPRAQIALNSTVDCGVASNGPLFRLLDVFSTSKAE